MSIEEHLPEDFENREALAGKFNSVEALAKSYNELHAQMGSTARVPKDGASGEEWSEFYQKMGAPAEKNGYFIPEEADGVTKGQLESLRNSAFEKGLTKDQWEALVGNAMTSINETRESAVKSIEDAKARWAEESKDKYGEDFEGKLARAQRTFQEMLAGDGEVLEILDASGLGNHPKLLELFVQIGEKMSDDNAPTDSGGSGYSGSVSTLARRGRELLKKGSVGNPGHPEYESDYTEYMKIQQKLLEEGYSGLTDPRLRTGMEFPLYEDA